MVAPAEAAPWAMAIAMSYSPVARAGRRRSSRIHRRRRRGCRNVLVDDLRAVDIPHLNVIDMTRCVVWAGIGGGVLDPERLSGNLRIAEQDV